MKITIKPEAKELLASKIAPNEVFFLTLNDGSSKYSKVGGTCSIGANFQFVASEVLDDEYNIPVENDAGFTIYTGEPELVFMGDGLILSSKNAMLALSDNSGILDGAVTIAKNDLSLLSEEEIKALSAKMC